jgi:hypothetical protein
MPSPSIVCCATDTMLKFCALLTITHGKRLTEQMPALGFPTTKFQRSASQPMAGTTRGGLRMKMNKGSGLPLFSKSLFDIYYLLLTCR